ncbi:hypothetical protein [Streptomyces sp. bgisy027]|uniref:hypothetical protein n=1 Tax=Streptomyces sp. bgisy027 TaxID=3413770 RepID=UPI003D710EBD
MLPMPQLPAAIGSAQVHAALEVLGLPHHVRSLTMDAHGVTLVLLALDQDGHLVMAGDDNVLLTVHVPYAQEHVHDPLTPEQVEKIKRDWEATVRPGGPNHGPVVL